MYTNHTSSELYAMYLAIKRELSNRGDSPYSFAFKIRKEKVEAQVLMMVEKMKIVNKEFDIDIHAKSRRQHLVNIRMSLALHFRCLGMSYNMIGKVLKKDHATIIYYERRGLEFLAIKDPAMTEVYNRVNDILQ